MEREKSPETPTRGDEIVPRVGVPDSGRIWFDRSSHGPRWEAGAGPSREESGADVASFRSGHPEGHPSRPGRVFQGNP